MIRTSILYYLLSPPSFSEKQLHTILQNFDQFRQVVRKRPVEALPDVPDGSEGRPAVGEFEEAALLTAVVRPALARPTVHDALSWGFPALAQDLQTWAVPRKIAK